jgi:hypothetical protein
MIVVRVAVALQYENVEAVWRLKQLIQAPPQERNTNQSTMITFGPTITIPRIAQKFHK